MTNQDSIVFKHAGRVYSVTRVTPCGVVHASKTLKGRRLRGRPRHFRLENVQSGFHRRQIVRAG